MHIKRQYIFLYVLVPYSFFIMLFFTKSSPLFWLNDWVDSNAFFTVGKGIINGLVPYRDLFEQKGPLLYFLHALAVLISPDSFLGVYLLESIAMSANLILLYKIARHYLNSWHSIWCSLFFPIFILYKPHFKYGDSAEQFATPFLMGLFYFMFIFIWNRYKVKPVYFFVQGILAGCVFWMKFTLIGSWIGFALVFLPLMLWRKQFKCLIQYVIAGLLGFFISTLPWLFYFSLTRSLDDLFHAYFYYNLFIYPPEQNSFIYRFMNAIMILAISFIDEWLIFQFLFIGSGAFIITDILCEESADKGMFISALFCSGLATFFGGRDHYYYYLIIMPYAFLGLLTVLVPLLKHKQTAGSSGKAATTVLLAGYCFFLTLCVNQNIRESRLFISNEPIFPSDELSPASGGMAQFIFADIMNQRENPTMLNYGFADGGFYTAADILPINRFFMKQNINNEVFPENIEEHNQIVREEAVDFLVLCTNGAGSKLEAAATAEMLERYRLIAAHEQVCEDSLKVYWLLERNSNYDEY